MADERASAAINDNPDEAVIERPDWWVEPLATGARSGCLNCPPKPSTLPMNAVLAVGFGMVVVRKDDEVVWCGDDEHRWIRRYERLAAQDPDHDWRVEFIAPLGEQTYQRHGEREWVLIEKGMGFA